MGLVWIDVAGADADDVVSIVGCASLSCIGCCRRGF